MADDMTGKVALVTGGGSGIGRATVLAFAKRGATVATVDVDESGGAETVRLAGELGAKVDFWRVDVSKAGEVEAMLSRIVESHGRLDYAYNNAGIEGPTGSLVDCSEADFDKVISVNLKGVWLCMKSEIPVMVAVGGGAIVNTSSISGLKGSSRLGPYTGSKFGVAGLTRSAALEFGGQGVRVNAICPGTIDTPMVERLWGADPNKSRQLLEGTPLHRQGDPAEVAEVVVWLCSDAASYVNGNLMKVDGGYLA